MYLTRDQLAKLINDHVQGYRDCKGSYQLADLIITADRDTKRERYEEWAQAKAAELREYAASLDKADGETCACGNGPVGDYFCCAVGDGCASWCHDEENSK